MRLFRSYRAWTLSRWSTAQPKSPNSQKDPETIVAIVSPHSRNLIAAVQYTTKPNSTLRTPQQTSSNFQSRPYPERKLHAIRLNSQASETPRTSAAKIRAAARSKLSRPLVSGSSKLSQMLIHVSRCASMPPFGGQSLCVLEPGVCMSYHFPHRNPPHYAAITRVTPFTFLTIIASR